MSNSAKTAEIEEVDENILLDDGFSIVDDINMESAEGANEKTNDVRKEEVNSNIKEETTDKSVESKKRTDEGKEKSVESKKQTDGGKDKSVETKKQTDEGKDKSVAKETAEPKSESSKTCGDSSTLILTNDVDLGTEAPPSQHIKVKVEKDSENAKKEEASQKCSEKQEKDLKTTKTPPVRKKVSSNFVWIMNISNSINASSLKKHFSDCGRVNTAKVVTNGKLFFGYLEFETSKAATECVEKMNNSVLGGKKILVSKSRPDVTKKTSNYPQKKILRTAQPSPKRTEATPKKNDEEADSKKTTVENKKESVEKAKKDDKTKSDDEKKGVEDKTKTAESDKKKKVETNKTPRSGDKEPLGKNDDLKNRMNETKRKLDVLRTDLDRTQIELRNLRRRLTTAQKKSKEEEQRAEKYRLQMRKLSDELKEAKLEFKREVHHLTKKHKLELKKAEFDRESFMKREEDLRRRQEDLSREFKKLEEAKKSFEHLKRPRKSRSRSPPHKRFRGREAVFSDVSPPPPPKLSGEVRKPLLDRPPSSYYEEKKPRAIYERLGDYGEKSYSKDSNGRYRGSYPDSTGPAKSSWSQSSTDTWRKNTGQSSSSNFLQPYMERFGGDSYEAQSSSSYYPPGTSDYIKHFDSSRKY